MPTSAQRLAPLPLKRGLSSTLALRVTLEPWTKKSTLASQPNFSEYLRIQVLWPVLDSDRGRELTT